LIGLECKLFAYKPIRMQVTFRII